MEPQIDRSGGTEQFKTATTIYLQLLEETVLLPF